MPHKNTWEQDNLYREFSGEIASDEILESNFKLQAHPNFESIKYIINDFTEVTAHNIELVHANVYAKTDEIISNTKGKLKIALIVPINSTIMEAAIGYRTLMINSLFSCEIFNTLEEAKAWATGD